MQGRLLRFAAALALVLVSVAARGAIVINEIMYNPPSGDDDETYIELYNTSAAPVNLANWRLSRGIRFTFPSVSLPGYDYLVVCRNETRIRNRYGITNTVGNFSGTLARGGETVALVDATSTVVDAVSYNDRSPWPIRADGHGAALGLLNPALDNSVGDHWAAEMQNNTGWRRIVTRGVFDPVGPVKVYLEIAGEARIDDVELIRESQPGVNLLTNPGFESGATGWAFLGNHASSTVEAGDAHSGSSALHLRATGNGSFGSNYVSQNLAIAATNREFFTLSLWAKPLSAVDAITLGSDDGRHGTLYEVFDLGTSMPEVLSGSPGRQNYVYQTLPQPRFTKHDRLPDHPIAGQAAGVVAVVENPAYVVNMRLYYAVQSLPLGSPAPDPEALSFTPLAMTATGSTFTTTIPGQPAGSLVRYYIRMTSTNGGATFRRPAENEIPRYYGYYTSPTLSAHKVPIFYLQVNPTRKALIDNLAGDLSSGMFKGNNFDVRADVVDMKRGEYFGDIHTRYRGGVGHRYLINTYKVQFNDGHRWDGLRTLNLTPNNQGRSQTTLGLANALAHRLELLLGVPALDMAQWARVYFNGTDRGLYTIVEQPDQNLLERYALSTDGQLFKSNGWRLNYPRIRGDEALFNGPMNDGQDGARKLRDSIANAYTVEDFQFAYDQDLPNSRGYQDLLFFIQTINDIPNSYPMTTANPDYVTLADCNDPSATMLVQMRNYLRSMTDVDLVLRKLVIDIVGPDGDRQMHNHYWYMGADNKWWFISWDRDLWTESQNYHQLFMDVGRWYKNASPYPRVFRTSEYQGWRGPWIPMTVFMYVPEFRRQYYRFVREAYEEIVTPFTVKNYIDKQLAYVTPEHTLAGSVPSLVLSDLQAQQTTLNARRVAVFQYMQTVFDMDPALVYPLVSDVRHTPAVPAPSQTIEFQAHAVSSVGTGLCSNVTLMLKGPGGVSFAPHPMTRVRDDAGYTGSVPDPDHTYYYRVAAPAAGLVYQYYVVASDLSGSVRTTTAPRNGPTNPKRVMADNNPAASGRGIVINEIMYNSDLPANEYVELTNISSRIVDLGGWSLIDNSTKRPFIFENDTTLAPGEFLVIAANAWRVKQIYGITNVVGDYAFRLANDADTIYLRDRTSTLIDMVAYRDRTPWPTVANGHGPSLELRQPTLDNNNFLSYGMKFPPGHRGTPGRANYVLTSRAARWNLY
jgi:hypothetical protein